MKTSEKRRALYDAISDIDPALIQEATMPRQAKVLRTVWRVAASAAMVAILIGVLAGLPERGGEPFSFFSIYVYANETDSVELSAGSESSTVSNIVTPNTATELPGVHSVPQDKATESKFRIDIWLGTDLSIFMGDRDDELPNLTVLCNGEVIEGEYGENIIIGLLASTISKEVGYSILGNVDQLTDLQIILTALDGTLLQKSDILITPLAAGGYDVKLTGTYVTDAYMIDPGNE